MTGHNFLPNKLSTNVDTQSPTILPEMPYSSNQTAKRSLNRPYHNKELDLAKDRNQSFRKLNELNDQILRSRSQTTSNNQIHHKVRYKIYIQF